MTNEDKLKEALKRVQEEGNILHELAKELGVTPNQVLHMAVLHYYEVVINGLTAKYNYGDRVIEYTAVPHEPWTRQPVDEENE